VELVVEHKVVVVELEDTELQDMVQVLYKEAHYF